jgi:hypothetical protein
MTIVFIVVGALAYLSDVFVVIPTFLGVSSRIQSSVATTEVESAYSSLTTASERFRASTQTCASVTSSSARLQCLELADTTWSQALQSYGTSISEIVYPSSSAQAAAISVKTAVASAVSVIDGIAASPNAQSYSAAASSPALQTALDNVDSSYDQLVEALATS